MASEVNANLEMVRNQLKEGLSSKADQGLVERLRDQLVSKCDHEYIQTLVSKVRTELD